MTTRTDHITITMNREEADELMAVLGHASGREDFPDSTENILVDLEAQTDALDNSLV